MNNNNKWPEFLIVAGSAVCATPVSAYQQLADVWAVPMHRGEAIEVIDDVDGDGVQDVLYAGIAGETGDAGFTVRSMATGATLYDVSNVVADFHGVTALRLADIDGDGVGDYAIGDPSLVQGQSLVSIRSGVDGSEINYLVGVGFIQNYSMGASMAVTDDLNADGIGELVVGMPEFATLLIGTAQGRVSCIDSASSAPGGGTGFWTVTNPNTFSSGQRFGFAVSRCADITGDGVAEVAASQLGTSEVFILSGSTGATLQIIGAPSTDPNFGYTLEDLGDVTGDGVTDLAVGHPGGTSSAGSVHVYSGANFGGGPFYSVSGVGASARLGLSLAGGGDVNSDGTPDFIAGGTLVAGQSAVAAYSGADGTVIYQIPTQASLVGGDIVDVALGDVTADGSGDILLLAPEAAYLTAFTGAGLAFQSDFVGTSYCGPANASSAGVGGVITAADSVAISDNSFDVTASSLPLNVIGFFVVGDGFALSMPAGSQGTICIGGGASGIGRFTSSVMNSGSTGSFSLNIDLTQPLPNPGGPVVSSGETWNFQAFFRDLNPTLTSNLTNAISVTFN